MGLFDWLGSKPRGDLVVDGVAELITDGPVVECERDGCLLRLGRLDGPALEPTAKGSGRGALIEWTRGQGRGFLGVEPKKKRDLLGFQVTQKLFLHGPEQPGRAYEIALVLPVRGGSLTLSAWAGEGSETGLRESFVLDALLGAGLVTPNPATGRLEGWTVGGADPDDPLAPNLSEQARFDPKFPDHPLSRVRRAMEEFGPRLRIEGSAREAQLSWCRELFAAREASRPRES